ncbi:MAG: PhoU domain-containing protein [Candidatus Omnitrophota bacterium]
MKTLNEIKQGIASMAALSLKMWQLTHQSFIDHDLELLSNVLGEENKLNGMEKELTAELVLLGRHSDSAEEKSRVIVFADVVGDLELIGDYCKDILERVQIKIAEKLLFSDEAVQEYEQLYRKAEDALKEVASALERDDLSRVKQVASREEHIDSLVDAYRQKHNQRMIDGICSPMACNMFLNMLDFTAAVYYHTKKIARNLVKIR